MEILRAKNVVLGAGAMGCATAYQLAKRGEPVLLVEQYGLLHNRGSSHGAARITRHSYSDVRYARLMIDAFRAWRELEADAGRSLYVRSGGVSFCPSGVDYVDRVAESLAEIGVPHRRMSGEQLRRSHPAFEVPADTEAVFEPDAGILLAEACLGAEIGLARELAGDRFRIVDGCPITRLDLDSGRPTLIGDDIRIEADYLIVTAGAWVTRLCPAWSSGLVVTRQQVLYLKPSDSAAYEVGRFPVFVYKDRDEEAPYYGMPQIQGQGVKVARHAGPEFDPGNPDRPFDADYDDIVRHFLRWNLPALANAPVSNREVCLYTEDPGENFRIGLLPGRADVLVASPCSGHGFKFSPLIGRVLADLALHGTTKIDVSPWSWRPEKTEGAIA